MDIQLYREFMFQICYYFNIRRIYANMNNVRYVCVRSKYLERGRQIVIEKLKERMKERGYKEREKDFQRDSRIPDYSSHQSELQEPLHGIYSNNVLVICNVDQLQSCFITICISLIILLFNNWAASHDNVTSVIRNDDVILIFFQCV